MEKFSGKVALVTGGGQGIGAAIAVSLARQGALVAIANRNEKAMDSVKNQILEFGGTCLTVKTDITKITDIQNLFNIFEKKFGKLDILVNNAGTIRPALFHEMDEEDWDFIQRVDLKGLVFCTQHAAAIMKKSKYGKIINVSSMSADGVYMPGFASYSAAKAAVNNFTKTAARELGEWNINVNAVAPGEIITALTYQDQTKDEVEKKLKRSTEMTMMKRLGSPDDVASAVCFFASDESSFITGTVLPVDGGRIDRM